MDFFITAILGGIIIFCLYWLASINVNYWEKLGFPHAKSLPFFGNTLDIILKKKSLSDVLDEIYYKFDGEKCVGFLQFFNPVLLLRDPELIQQILIKDFSYFNDQGFVFDKTLDPLSSNLFNLSGNLWKSTRSKLLLTFTSNKMKTNMFGQIKSLSEQAVSYIKNKTSNELESRDVMSKLSLNIKGSIAYGINANAFSEEKEGSNEFLTACKLFFGPSLLQSIKFLISMASPRIQTLFKYKVLDKDVESFFFKFVEDTMKYREETGERRNDFLQLMIDLKKQEENAHNFGKNLDEVDKNDLEESDKYLFELQSKLEKKEPADTPTKVITEECIAAHTFVFISGGTESISTALSFAVYELAVNKDIQKRLQNEVDSLLSTDISYEKLKKCKYLDNFLKEVLRKHGTATPLTRRCSMDYQIPETNMIVKKGTLVLISQRSLQRDPKYFPNPEKFDPDRFDDPNTIIKGTYLPFGDGPRMCIAMRLAMLEMKTILAILISNFNIILSNKTREPLQIEKTSFFGRAEGGIWVRFEERKKVINANE
ncbi:putative cytochrome P450 6a14 [Lycorma delicatula]|uniref:putative cytochrome P450 6a14 n=1 Tax=Lycorma delicatula TaxID=130591 RepID=UPI003F515401